MDNNFKRGDVLCYPDGSLTLFNRFVDDGLYFAFVVICDKFKQVEWNITCTTYQAKLATKEQEEQLFKTIENLGYEFDGDKLVLQKIRHVKLNKDDVLMIDKIIDTIQDIIKYDCDVDDTGTKARFAYEKQIEWLKQLKNRR